MYALKQHTAESTKVIALGNRFTIQRYSPLTSNDAIGCVTGEDERFCFEIGAEVDAYITTIEGKTVEVINRGCGSKLQQPI
ncbi:TPA: hypothetical protein ACKPVT_001866 [Serratia marcescens]|nr:hypothetical protein [Serratia marcescens]HEJ8033593.1 hypothetical protein [Serratia marcescens]